MFSSLLFLFLKIVYANAAASRNSPSHYVFETNNFVPAVDALSCRKKVLPSRRNKSRMFLKKSYFGGDKLFRLVDVCSLFPTAISNNKQQKVSQCSFAGDAASKLSITA
jgi:hypothetical protein